MRLLHIHFFNVNICVMINKYYFEFSKLYGRMMRLEILMKHSLINSVISYYNDDSLKIFNKFFYNKKRQERYQNNKGNSFLAILKNPQLIDRQKFIQLVNIMYFSDILFLVLCCKEFFVPEITKKFYHQVPEKFSRLVKARHVLQDLRNVIAHYNFKDYEQNKQCYVEALLLFEIHMGQNIKGVIQFPKFNQKPTIQTILQAIKDVRPDLFEIDINRDDEIEYFYNKHRILLDLCDDIALFNNYEPQELPSPWTVLRQMYAIKKFSKNSNINVYETPLFIDLKN